MYCYKQLMLLQLIVNFCLIGLPEKSGQYLLTA